MASRFTYRPCQGILKREVAQELLALRRGLNAGDADPSDPYLEVRLNVQADGGWQLYYGSSDYDQDHRGAWGASSIPFPPEPFSMTDALMIAGALIDDVTDDIAQGSAD